MEIERKFLIKKLPDNLDSYKKRIIEQAYLNTDPVVRIRRDNAEYILTYKSSGLMSREEYNLPLNKEAYEHLLSKADGNIISKTRYMIPEKDGLTIELDIFHRDFEGIILAEVEFPDETSANAYIPCDWFAKDVTFEKTFHNSRMSTMSISEIRSLKNDIAI